MKSIKFKKVSEKKYLAHVTKFPNVFHTEGSGGAVMYAHTYDGSDPASKRTIGKIEYKEYTGNTRVWRIRKLPVVEGPVSMTKLRMDLFGVDRIPDKSSTHTSVRLFSGWYGKAETMPEHAKFLGYFNIAVAPYVQKFRRDGQRHKSSAHRIFIQCTCGKSVPAGRLAQHTH